MSANVAPSIVRTGLVLDLDAANSKSYVSGSLVWNNLTTNILNGNLINGPIFSTNGGGSITFDGLDDYADLGINPILDFTTNISVAAWINRASVQQSVDSSVIGKLSDQGQLYRGYMLWYNNNAISLYLNGGSRASTSTILANTWYYILGTYNGQTASIYVNGILSNSNNVVLSIDSVGNSFLIGRYPFGGSRNFTGNISNIQIYNRALSDSEVLQNYNALRGRFGL